MIGRLLYACGLSQEILPATPVLQMWKPDAESLSNLPEVSQRTNLHCSARMCEILVRITAHHPLAPNAPPHPPGV